MGLVQLRGCYLQKLLGGSCQLNGKLLRVDERRRMLNDAGCLYIFLDDDKNLSWAESSY
jgi:hypothetical protein